MKKLFILAAITVTMAATGCSGSSENNAGGNDSTAVAANESAAPALDKAAWPWDFPTSTGEQLKEGQLVLAPYTYYKVALDDGEDLTRKGLIFYNTTLKGVGNGTAVVNFKEDYKIPTTLVIGLPEGATAKKGDILLTWWQSGSGMKRAIVRDDSDPAQPIVDYLDMKMDTDPNSPTNFAEKEANSQLKPNSFIVLHDGQWEPGAQLACKSPSGKWDAATLIKATADKCLVLGFSDKVAVYPKSDCRLIPLSDEGVKQGDKVWGIFVGSYDNDYTVEKVDAERGRVWVTDDRGETEILSILEVTKVLD